MSRVAVTTVCAAPALVALFVLLAPITTDPLILFGGIAYDLKPNWVPGFSTIDPNQGYTAFALGVRATLDVLSGQLPLWNPHEGLGTPLLGEMQAAALFPPTLLLALPHGQVIEQAVLQVVAGAGTYLFLRRFGLGVTAALAGGLLFEFNGVFAWLRNAIYNPVAFLPWLFYAVETLFVAAMAGQTLRRRSGAIVVGAVAAALALYAGFPEVVYLYCLPLFGWVAIRAVMLPWRRALAFLTDQLLLAVAALLLSAPLLLAFGSFLAQANVGAHQDAGFADAVIHPGGMVMYLLPYFYGAISASSNPAIAAFWSNGGYLGLTVCVLAIGGALAHHRRPIVWFLAGWVIVAVGVSHGSPVLLALFRRLPLVTDAVFARYLNAGWLFCAITLAALFIDRLPKLSPTRQRQIGTVAVGIAILLLGSALALTWPTLATAWQSRQGQRIYVIASLAIASLLLGAVLATIWRVHPRRAPAALTALVAVEAILLYVVPFASSPPRARLDMQLVEFLHEHTGLQRVAIATGSGLTPNFGSAFGISTVNYDDLPVPERTIAFVKRELRPSAVPIMFRPDVSDRPDTPAQRRAEFLAHRPGYAKAGVRYVLASPDFFDIGPALLEGGTRAVTLASGQTATLSLARVAGQNAIDSAGIVIGTYGGTSDGRLAARLCQDGRCQESSADLVTATDNASLRIAFVPAFALTDAPYRLELSKRGGEHPVALWSKPPAPGEATRATGLSDFAGTVPQVSFADDTRQRRVLSTKTTTVFELDDTRAYASAPGCRVAARSHETMTSECDRPSRLTRLEVLMDGWTARVNGADAPVTLAEDTFQSVDVPAGHATIEFVYAPRGVRPALWVAAATLAILLATQLGRKERS